MTRIGILATAAAVLAGAALGPALAASHGHGHGAHTGHGAAQDGQTDDAAVRAYRAANERMHEGMAISFSGDADVDFARGMIPHHQGAIDMARIALEHGSDPEIRELAEQIIAAQESEIAFLEEWLERQGR
jgi:uncharacterized protein (DUF305 family)